MKNTVEKVKYEEAPKMRWYNKRHYQVGGGLIVPYDGSKCFDYYPFDLYEKDETKYSESPHQIFANIDISDNKSIQDFYYKYGPLGFYDRDVMKLVTYNPLQSNFKFPEGPPIAAVMRNPIGINNNCELLPLDDLKEIFHISDEKFQGTNTDDVLFEIPHIDSSDTCESLEMFKAAQKRFSFIMNLNSNLQHKKIEILKQLLLSIDYKTGYDIKNADDKQILITSSGYIWYYINLELDKTISLVLHWDDFKNELSRNISWRCESLLTAMYLMLLLDITKSKFNTKCSYCGTWFYAQRLHAEYCSDTCKYTVNKENQKYNSEYLKKGRVINLLDQGQSLLQISKTENIRKKTIERWMQEKVEV